LQNFLTKNDYYDNLRLFASSPLRLFASSPLRLFASSPLRLFASSPLRLFASSPLRLFAIAMLFLGLINTADAQVEECGTPDITPAQMQAFLEEIDTSVIATVASTSIAATSPWRICVWFYHLRYSDGSSDDQDVDPDQFIGAVNTYFSGTFEFVVCGTTNIDNDDYVRLDIGANSNNLDDLWAEIAALNEPLPENCIRVLMLGGGSIHVNGVPMWSGYAHDPLQYDKPAVFISYLNGRLWAHELGHYMGLPHTFFGDQYVNSPVSIGGLTYTCYQTGDGFCDTPADPGGCGLSGQCQITSCSPSLDPLGVAYNPDPTLIMSYYDNCQNRFSGEQHQRMRTLYLDHPKYEFLRNPAEECIASKYGYIERNCEGYVPFNEIEPLVYVPVQVRGESTPYCNPQDNKTDVLGRYLITPCSMTGVRRLVFPDRNFGNNPLDGISTIDLALINAHVLGIKKFGNPFQIIAADANNSGTVTTFDIVELRKLVLGLYNELPIGISWRYVPKLCTETQSFRADFYDDPFSALFTDPFQGFTRSYKSLTQGSNVPNTDSWMDFVNLFATSGLAKSETAWSFTGIKIGDVNCNSGTEGLQGGDHEFLIDSGSVSIGISGTKRIQVVASAPAEVLAWQFGVRYSSDSLTLSDLAPGTDAEQFDEDYFHITPPDSLQEEGMFRAIWFSPDGETVNIDSTVLFEFQTTTNMGAVDLSEVFKLNKNVLPFLFYDEDGEIIPDVTLTLRVSDVSQQFITPLVPGIKFNHATKPLRVKTFPVPFTSEVGFIFDLSQDEQVSLDIFDVAGALVSSINATLPAGPHELQITNMAGRPAGFYWYALRAGELVARGKLSKR